MRRREFIGVICGAALTRLSCAAAQQPGKVWRIGIVFTAERGEPDAKALEQSLAESEPALIEVPVGEMPSPWPFIDLPKVRGV